MGDSQQHDHDTVRYDAYMRHRENLLAGRQEETRSFDKHILALASGGLALSVLFLERLSPSADSWPRYFLYGAWTCLGLCISSILLSFVIGKVAYDREIAMWDQAFSSGSDPADNWHRSRTATFSLALKYAALGSFAIGIVLFIVFAISSLPTRADKENSHGKSPKAGATQATTPKAGARAPREESGSPSASTSAEAAEAAKEHADDRLTLDRGVTSQRSTGATESESDRSDRSCPARSTTRSRPRNSLNNLRALEGEGS